MQPLSCSLTSAVAILVEAITVVARISAIERRYIGGLRAFELDCPNRTYAHDQEVARIAFMNGYDVGALVDRLEGEGLELLRDGRHADLAVADAAQGLAYPCDWLRLGQIRETGVRFCELASALPSDCVVVPQGWFSSGMSYTTDFTTITPLRPGDGPDLFPVSDGRRIAPHVSTS